MNKQSQLYSQILFLKVKGSKRWLTSLLNMKSIISFFSIYLKHSHIVFIKVIRSSFLAVSMTFLKIHGLSYLGLLTLHLLKNGAELIIILFWNIFPILTIFVLLLGSVLNDFKKYFTNTLQILLLLLVVIELHISHLKKLGHAIA